MHDEPYTVFLGHKRTLEYVEDLCRGFANIIDNFKPGEIYNFGGETNYDIKYVSDLILKNLGRRTIPELPTKKESLLPQG
jgi:dTDP-glucose 4,6-dehydratase